MSKSAVEKDLKKDDLLKYTGRGFATFDKINTTMSFIEYKGMHDLMVEYKGMPLLVMNHEVELLPRTIKHKLCGTRSRIGTYPEDGVIDYHCKKCNVTFLNNEEQTIIS